MINKFLKKYFSTPKEFIFETIFEEQFLNRHPFSPNNKPKVLNNADEAEALFDTIENELKDSFKFVYFDQSEKKLLELVQVLLWINKSRKSTSSFLEKVLFRQLFSKKEYHWCWKMYYETSYEENVNKFSTTFETFLNKYPESTEDLRIFYISKLNEKFQDSSLYGLTHLDLTDFLIILSNLKKKSKLAS